MSTAATVSRSWARRAAVSLTATLCLTLAACGSGGKAAVPTVNLYYAPEQNLQHIVDDCNAKARGRYRIAYQALPRAADDQRTQLVRRLAARDSGMDVLGLDVTWTPEFASAGWVLEWTGARRAEAERGTLSGPLATARYQNRLYAAPKNTNTQLLWYRSDIVDRPPRTWDEMIKTADALKAQGRPYQVITMGAQYEGLVVLYNTLVASAGGHILNQDGTRAVLDAGSVRALALLHHFAISGVTNPSFTNSQEDAARLQFQAGDGAFELNYPFVYPAMRQDAPGLATKVRWARYPAVDANRPSAVTIGGFNLAVSTYSRHPHEAFDAALCLRSADHQKYSAIHDGVPPTIERAYADPELARAYPMKSEILAELHNPAIRPSTPAYQNVSTVLSATLSPPSNIQPEQTAARLRGLVQDALESKGVLP